MGWLKKHLNPNPVKQIKNIVQDTKDSIKKPMAMMAGKKSAPTSSGKASPVMGIASRVIGRPMTPADKKRAITTGITVGRGNAPAPRAATAATIGKRTVSNTFTTGQGKAPAPHAYTPAVASAPVPAAVRKSKTRNTMSTLGAGKYRIK